MRSRARIAAALMALVALVGGCATRAPGSAGGPGTGGGPGSGNAGQDCDSGGNPTANPPPLTPLPPDAMLVEATRCVFEHRTVPGDGEWLTRLEQKATAGLDSLATALRLPSQTAAAGQDCPLVYYVPTVITVTDTAGHQIHPEVPYGACAEPLKAAIDAIAALPWTTVGTTRIRQTRSELEVSSGCSGAWKPTIALMAGGSGTQVVEATARPLRVCRFDLDPDPANVISGDKGATYRMGRLVSASTMDATGGGELLKAVASAPRVTGACTQPQAPFAVVYPLDGSAPFITVERGGCFRAFVDGENYLRQLDAALVGRLIG